DDDVRWRRAQLVRAVRLLDGADLVRPQNVFDPLPWHARWDTGRTLINRAIAADYPGTYGLRRGIFLRMGGYDGDAMFENLEMARTIRAAGGVERRVDDLFVRRRPPTAAHFWRQRTRQAYDDLAQPGRLLAELAVLPMTIALLWSGHRYLGRAGVVGAALVPVIAALLVAEAGRRRDGGREAFAETAAWWAPVWVAERAVLIWFAVGCRLRGGVRYGDQRLLLAAHRVRTLRRRVRSAPPLRCQSGERADAGPTGGHRTR
ncbi:MAG TPA: hypothetical protein VFP34_08115, partial [Microlunatus sp.]|nr:hypothetical protein [Microlunatus sp.]